MRGRGAALSGVAAGADGVHIEVHNCPEEAMSDGAQALLPDQYAAVAAQMRDAGINVKREVLPGSTFWNDWAKYPFSSTNWNHRPLGTQVLGLAYRSGEAWNEAGFANAEFDSLLAEANSIADADKRRVVMGKLQAIMIDEGVTIQPYWRTVSRHHKDNLVGVDMHIAYLPQIYKWALKA